MSVSQWAWTGLVGLLGVVAHGVLLEPVVAGLRVAAVQGSRELVRHMRGRGEITWWWEVEEDDEEGDEGGVGEGGSRKMWCGVVLEAMCW